MDVLRGVSVLLVIGCVALNVCPGCSSSKVTDVIEEDAQGPAASSLPPEQQVFRYVATSDTGALGSLLAANPDLVNYADEADYTTPLHAAASMGNDKMVNFLIDHGADPSARDVNGESPADVARQQNHLGLAKKLQEMDNGQ